MAEEQTEQFTGELPKITRVNAEFVDTYFLPDVHYNQTEAYQRTHPKCTRETARREGHRLLTNPHIQAHIQARFAEMHQSKDEILAQFAEEGRAHIGMFFKPIDEWTFYPLQTDEILESKEVEEDQGEGKPPKIRIMHRVYKVVLDVDKLLDPLYSHLIHKFVDKGRDGMSIELYDAQAARREALRVQGAYKDKVALTGANGAALIPEKDKEADARHDRALSSLADAIRASIPGAGAKSDGAVDAAE